MGELTQVFAENPIPTQCGRGQPDPSTDFWEPVPFEGPSNVSRVFPVENYLYFAFIKATMSDFCLFFSDGRLHHSNREKTEEER